MGEQAMSELPGFDKPVRVLLVVARGAAALVAGAEAVLARVGAEVERVDVPGVLELAPAIALAERLESFDGYVALGSAQGPLWSEVTRVLQALALGGALNGNGVVLAEGSDAAMAGGQQAAEAVLHLIALSRRWSAKTKGIGFRA
jgi:6,7-dimethyl-8-ribityllumazine synthase